VRLNRSTTHLGICSECGWSISAKYSEELQLPYQPMEPVKNALVAGQLSRKVYQHERTSVGAGVFLIEIGTQLEISSRRGLSTVGHTGTWILDPNACGELTATDVEVILHRQVDSANQESSRL
jgi:hypothetical protein